MLFNRYEYLYTKRSYCKIFETERKHYYMLSFSIISKFHHQTGLTPGLIILPSNGQFYSLPSTQVLFLQFYPLLHFRTIDLMDEVQSYAIWYISKYRF